MSARQKLTPLVTLAFLGVCLTVGGACAGAPGTALEQEFRSPPAASQVWCYWWWLNGAASKEGITRDFEEMKKQGIAGALLFDAGEAGPEAPRGPAFMSDAWRDLFKHAVREADRLGIALSVNLCSGWNAGGAWVTPEHAAKKVVHASLAVRGPKHEELTLPKPPPVQGFYRDIAVLAYPVADERAPDSKRTPKDSTVLRWDHRRVVDLTSKTDAEGRLTWDVPPGLWDVIRIGYTLHGDAVKCVGSGPTGLEIDTMSAAAMDAQFTATGAKLIADAGPLVGKTLQYFHIDSWELGQPTWTPAMRDEFRKRRGYDPLPYLPALIGDVVDNPGTTQRFLADYRRTAADLVAANYYGRLRALTVAGGLRGTHPESGGPFFTHWIDALECEAINDVPMGEFWRRNSEPEGAVGHEQNPSLKQIATVAHTYGKPVCQAEAFTSFACDWIDDPWSMKDVGDYAFCSGLTRHVLCFWVHQPRLDAKPGFQWAHVGTHFDSNLTWWDMSHAWLTYLARCQHLLRRGRFVADFAYFRGEAIPGFLVSRESQTPTRPAGFDYDVLSRDVLLRASVADGRLVLPGGMSYRYLVLPHAADTAMSTTTLGKLVELVEAGAAVIGPPPVSSVGLADAARSDRVVKEMAALLWGAAPGASGERRVGKGRVVWGLGLDRMVQADGLAPDVELRKPTAGARFDWIHRQDGPSDLYFVSNQSALPVAVEGVFRATGQPVTLWDAVTGQVRRLPVAHVENGRTVVPLELAPREAYFVVFGHDGGAAPAAPGNFPPVDMAGEVSGPWHVQFDRAWGGPSAPVEFSALDDWSTRPEEGIRHYSGRAVYHKRLEMPTIAAGRRAYLDLGSVKNVARVRLNGDDLGVAWTAPWRVEITRAARPGMNDLEIEVANLWPNRLIGDAGKPRDQRLTTTNVHTYDDMSSGTWGCPICAERKKSGQPARLLPSGLLGPVRVMTGP
jgi:alpha-L-rhamnosidase